MCKVLGINRSTYYKCLDHKISNRDIENQKLDKDVLAIYYDTKRRYGAPMIHPALLEKGWYANLKRVQLRMALLGIHSIVIKKYRHFSDNKPVAKK
ncbi:MAG: IS3 family transposase [Eubacteriales bacterium]|nr:IS3 family transposase [Eubacteriales bacterium]